MTAAFFSTISHLRLHNQQLIDAQLTMVEDVVHWLGAVQAQDFASAKWALALRVPSATQAAVERAFNEGKQAKPCRSNEGAKRKQSTPPQRIKDCARQSQSGD